MQKSKWVLILIFVAVFSAMTTLMLSSKNVQDAISRIGYEPSSEMSALISDLDLTTKGLNILKANRPEIQDQAAFNVSCRGTDFTEDASLAVLGCHSSNRIYIYNIKNAELKGITQSTLAHELLHAVWERLTNYERSTIGDELLAFYNENSTKYSEELSVYNETQLIEELHSRIGTQETDLSDTLESYYSKYFTDQDKIVAYYNRYKSTFLALEAEIKQLKAEITALDLTITNLKSEYTNRTAILVQNIEEFNACAETTGCFASNAAFYSRRAELVEEQRALSNMYDQINSDITSYNQKVAKYNQNLLHTEDLESTINSLSSPVTL